MQRENQMRQPLDLNCIRSSVVTRSLQLLKADRSSVAIEQLLTRPKKS